MKRILNICLLIGFLIGYLEWGKNNNIFILQAEMEMFQKAAKNPLAILHPFILIPFFGQLLIIISLFQRVPGRRITLFGLGGMSLIMLFLFFIGIISLNFKILGSTIPFIVTGIFVLRSHWKPGLKTQHSKADRS